VILVLKNIGTGKKQGILVPGIMACHPRFEDGMPVFVKIIEQNVSIFCLVRVEL
jgi:hypothetical protein